MPGRDGWPWAVSRENGRVQEPADDDRQLWDAVYERAGAAGVSWYQREAGVSLELIDRLAIPPDTATIDVGGGASALVDQLRRRGFSDLTVVDVSASALDTVRQRLGEDAHAVHLLRENVISGWNPSRRYGLWHDRAVFHFFVDEADRTRYRNVLRSALRDDGVAIVATFAADGPERCSGLPVARYGPDALVAALGDDLEMLMSRREEHKTSTGAVQPFTWVIVRLSRGRAAREGSR